MVVGVTPYSSVQSVKYCRDFVQLSLIGLHCPQLSPVFICIRLSLPHTDSNFAYQRRMVHSLTESSPNVAWMFRAAAAAL
ncbi:hypothetical protein TNCT_492941 [Trichonephila clavata]|uniref:Uncharacterized protein n=1 Tax=Trichonephila clavata TaxID=2740835 RepID=A0A8X6HL67_TRICU|nr:hypothetical protein TNCT_492941 [Trichonephila clavata]